jgi:hypothetical protein
VRPFVLIETIYENEHNSKPEQIRRQAYWAVTCGACGQFFGNNPIWHFDGPGLFAAPRGWRSELDGAGSRDMAHLRTALIQHGWLLLVPDFKNALVVEGVGKGVETITAAAAPDGTLAIIYVPSTGREGRDFTVDMGRFTASVTSSWFNPTNGQIKPLAKKPLANQGRHRFRTPGDTGTKTNDWLLVLEVH